MAFNLLEPQKGAFMEKIVRKYSLSAFYLLTLLLSAFLLPLHFIFQSAGEYALSFTQLSPALAVLLISFALRDKTIFSDIKSRFLLNRLTLKWALPALLIPFLCILISSWGMGYAQAAYVPWQGDAVFYLLNISAMLIGSVAEEIGWRGFLLPGLQKRHTPFVSSVIVGVLWGIWHLNLTGGIAGFVLYIITITEMSVLMTWVYNKSKGSLLLMSLWHLSINITSHVFLWDRFNLQLFIVQSLVFGLACVILLMTDGKSFFSKVPAS